MSTNFKQTDIGLIPEDWEIKKVKELAIKLKAGGTPRRSVADYWGGDIPFLSIEDMTNSGLYINGTKEFITEEGLNNSSTWIVPINSVLLSMYASIGKTSINLIPLVTNQAILAIIPNDTAYNLYIAYCLSYNAYRLSSYQIQSTQKNVNKAIVENFEISLPSLPEQKKIAHVLSKIQQAIETQEQIIKSTQELKKALMQKLFTEGLNSEQQKQTEIGPIPESWEIKEFKDYIVLQRGKDLPKYNFEEGIIPVAGSNGIIGYHSKSFVNAPGLTVGRSGSAGIVTFYNVDFWAHNTVLYAKDFKGNYPLFVFYHLQFIDLSRFKSGVSVPTLNRNSFSGLEIAIPSITEQKNIAHSISQLDNKIEFEQGKLFRFKDLFQSCLNQLMTGQIRLREV